MKIDQLLNILNISATDSNTFLRPFEDTEESKEFFGEYYFKKIRRANKSFYRQWKMQINKFLGEEIVRKAKEGYKSFRTLRAEISKKFPDNCYFKFNAKNQRNIAASVYVLLKPKAKGMILKILNQVSDFNISNTKNEISIFSRR